MKALLTVTIAILIIAPGLFNMACGQNEKQKEKKDDPGCPNYSAAEHTSHLGDGFKMEIVGTERDIVEFWHNNKKIAIDPIRNGVCMNFWNRKPSRISESLHIFHAQHGSTPEDGNIYAYAIVGERVFRSPLWTETKDGDHARLELTWNGLIGEIHNGQPVAQNKIATFTFDPATNKWTCSIIRDGLCRGETIESPFPQ